MGHWNKDSWGSIPTENLRKIIANTPYLQNALKTFERMRNLYPSDELSDTTIIAKIIIKTMTIIKMSTGLWQVFLHAILLTRLFEKLIQRVT